MKTSDEPTDKPATAPAATPATEKPAQTLPEPKRIELPGEAPRTRSPRPPEPTDVSTAEEELRYVARPKRRGPASGRQNLIWGVLVFGLGLLLLGYALYLAGAAVIFTLAVALATAALLYVLARARLFRQRNGPFLASALVFLFGVMAVLVQQGWLAVVARRDAPAVTSEQPAGAVVAGQPAEASAPVAKGPAEASSAKPVEPKAGGKGALTPALRDAFPASFAQLESSQLARVTREFEVQLDGKTYYLNNGDIFPIASVAGGEVRLLAGNRQVALPASAVEFSIAPNAPNAPNARGGERGERTPSAGEAPLPAPMKGDSKAAITDRAMREARSRYPALGVLDSPENRSFVDTVKELRYTGMADFFTDPEWPIRLAEMLAIREGWRKAGEPETQTLPPPNELPEEPAPAPAQEEAAPTPRPQPPQQLAPPPSAPQAEGELPLPQTLQPGQ